MEKLTHEIVGTNEYFEITLRNGVNGMSCNVLVHPEHTLKAVYECSSCMLGINYNSSKKIIVEFYNDGEINEKNRELFESLDACDEMMTKNLDIYSSTLFTSLGARSGEIFKKFCVHYKNVFEKGDKYFAKL